MKESIIHMFIVFSILYEVVSHGFLDPHICNFAIIYIYGYFTLKDGSTFIYYKSTMGVIQIWCGPYIHSIVWSVKQLLKVRRFW